MSDSQFENIITLLNDQGLESVKQGLMLWETLMDLGEDRGFYLDKLHEIDFTDLKGSFSYGFGGKKVPSWLRTAEFRLYVSLWALGYLAKHGNETALSIKKIELNDPVFFTFPETFIHLSGLTHFELQRSKWTEIEDVWTHFSNLLEVNLFDNEITTLPPSLGTCTTLQKLDLSYNPISELPECVRKMTALQELNLRDFDGVSIPEWFGELRELRILNAESASITSLPNSIGNLQKLHTLSLRWSKLAVLPETLGDCEALKSMDIASTDVTTFPSSLPVLQAWESRINTAWVSFQQLSKLHTMEIWTEDLNKEIDFAWFPSLKSLTINSGDCSLKNIDHCSMLEKLDVGREQTSVPDAVCQSSTLKELILSYSKVTSLPDNIGQLTSLRKIGLSSLELSEEELFKLAPLLPKVAGTTKRYSSSKREIRWYLEVDAYGNTEPIDDFRRRLLMRDFSSIAELSQVEQLSGYLDAQTLCADVSTAENLILFTIYADEAVHPSWLERLSPCPTLQTVQFKCTFTEFPDDVMRRLLIEPTLSQTGELTFSVDVNVSKEYERDLWNLKLAIAKEHGLLSKLTCFTSKVLTAIPKLLTQASSLIKLNCKEVLCSDFPEAVLKLPHLMTIEGKEGKEGKEDEKPDAWPVRTVTFQTLDAFLDTLPQYDNLRTLNLKGAWLSAIPEVVLKLQTLRVLDLSWNRITGLPTDVSAWSNLTSLSLVGNQISELPDNLLALPKLQTVSVPKTMDVETLKTAYPNIDFEVWSS